MLLAADVPATFHHIAQRLLLPAQQQEEGREQRARAVKQVPFVSPPAAIDSAHDSPNHARGPPFACLAVCVPPSLHSPRMGASSALRLIRVAALAGAAINGLPADISAGGGGGAAAAVDAAVRRVLVAEGGDGLSSGVVAVYCIVSVILVAVSGLMVSAGVRVACRVLRLCCCTSRQPRSMPMDALATIHPPVQAGLVLGLLSLDK